MVIARHVARAVPLCVALLVALGTGCQGYPFEQRLPVRADGRKVTQQVASVTPTDVLFVVDNSGSMLNQRLELIDNVGRFIAQMASSTNDFHVGVVTTDVECNIPERDCVTNTSSASCCALTAGQTACVEQDLDGDGKVDWSNCDGGRLRAPKGKPAYFGRPTADPNAWVDDFSNTIRDLGCQGSGFESGLEAARRAINCALDLPDCPSPSIAQLNAGFIRDAADLVVVFVTDEDDCSFVDPNRYLRPPDPSSAADQATHLCAPTECYAHYGKDDDANGDGLQNWADPAFVSPSLFRCASGGSAINRLANPPYPDDIALYVDGLAAAKGGNIKKVRGAGIVSGIAEGGRPLGFRSDVCIGASVGPTAACGCWSASISSFYCALTQRIGHFSTPFPPNQTSNECSNVGAGNPNDITTPQPGCKAMPGHRYLTFLEALSQRRTQAGVRSDTLV
ncbi:MAG TPA: vWA domain-containing protein, partial [Myxococcota bacterium]|nr:vWA domain-containing protein [Myxococcota bacterium]